jgi:hypothetical protein
MHPSGVPRISRIPGRDRPRSHSAGSFDLGGEWSIQFPKYRGIKCYAVVSGHCWLIVEGLPELRMATGDCFLLPSGRPSRFRTIKNAISYCGLCGDERSSADKVMRMSLSKQRNKHIQRALVEAAKLAPRQSHELAIIYDRGKQQGNGNRATLAVARKMVAYLLAVDRQQRDFIPEEERRTPAA